MKLGKQTGSFCNHLYSRSTLGQPEPVVGMGATILGWTDRHAGTIICVVPNPTKRWTWRIDVQQDNVTRIDKNGMSEMQEYLATPNPTGTVTPYIFDGKQWREGYLKDGKFRVYPKGEGSGLMIGIRQEYYDWSF